MYLHFVAVDPELQKIVTAAAGALVSSMTTDGWRWARDSFAALCGRDRPDAVVEFADELGADRRRVLDARRDGDDQAEAGVRSYWDGRLRRLVERHPEAGDELDALVRRLAPVLPPPAATFNTVARDSSQVFNNSGTMSFGGRP